MHRVPSFEEPRHDPKISHLIGLVKVPTTTMLRNRLNLSTRTVLTGHPVLIQVPRPSSIHMA